MPGLHLVLPRTGMRWQRYSMPRPESAS
jgi:hypothetical protein